MSKEMKYVIINECQPILFTSGQQHSDFGYMKPTSAGICRIQYEDGTFVAECYGESISLKLKPTEYDRKRIERMLNHY